MRAYSLLFFVSRRHRVVMLAVVVLLSLSFFCRVFL